MILEEKEIRLWEKWASKSNQPLTLRFLCTEHHQSTQFTSFLETLSAAVPQITVITETTAGNDPPALALGEIWRFQALPQGRKLEFFLEIAGFVDGPPPQLPVPLKSRVEALPLGPEIKIFISPHCPFCPQVVRQVIPLVQAHPHAQATLIDCDLFPETARALAIKAVPTVIINNTHRLIGEIRLGEVVDLLEDVDPTHLGPDSLERMLKAGQAGQLAEMMLKRQLIFSGFQPLLLHPEWSVRLGAIVVLETIAETNKDLAASVLQELWLGCAEQDKSIQGDILYLIGEIGDSKWIPVLESRLQKEGDMEIETREVVEEALDKLKGNSL
jgi:hypothetical protein